MTLPAGITTCTVTIGKALGSLGEDASLSGTLTLDRRLVWSATGDTLYGVPSTVTASQSGGWLSFVVAHVNQAGFVDQSGNSITGFSYTFSGRATFADGSVEPIVKHFQVFVGQSTIDLDLLPDGPATLPVVTPIPPVDNAAVAGFVTNAGATKDALSASYAALWKPSVVVLAGAVRQAPSGETIKRIANGTTRPAYDATEVALWTPVAAAGIDALLSPPVLGRMEIVTSNKAAIDSKVDYRDATITISGVPGVADYFGKVQIRGRGNYTWGLPKKPYKLKFASKVSLMGMPAFDDWALLANASDPSLINGALAFAVGAGCDGLAWTPKSQFVELTLNGEYVGLYQLTETVKRGTARVNIDKAGTTGLPLTGGYMLEIGSRDISEGTPGFTTTNGVGVIYDDPDGTVTANATYIQTKVQEFETALYASTWLDPTTGYARFIDRNSFIDWYLVEELTSNQDSGFATSCKFWRNRDTADTPGRFHMGPLWDFDISFGSVINIAHPAEGLYTRPDAKWLDRMMADPTFSAALATRWSALATRLTATFNTTVDAYSARIAGPALRDQEAWTYTADWAALAAFKKAWLTQRIAWLDRQFVTPNAVPAAVTGLVTGMATDTTVGLTWAAPAFTSGAAPSDYSVQYRVTGASSWTTFAHGASTATSATVTGLTGNTSYQFRVAGVNVVGTGAYSNTAAAATSLGTTYSDNFTRADGDTLGSTPVGAKAWTTSGGSTWGIRSNTASQVSSGDGYVTFDSGQVDHDVALTLTPPGSNAPGLVIAADTAGNFVRIICLGTNIRYDEMGVSDGASVTVPGVLTEGVDAVLRAKKVGSTVTVYVNGTSVLTRTLHADLVSKTRVGMFDAGAGTVFKNIISALSQ